MKKINLLFSILFFVLFASAQTTSTFDDLSLGTDTAWTGSTFAGGFSDGNAYFENQYDTTGGYISWGGFVYSDKTDSTTAGYYNQYSAITTKGYAGSANYAVAYDEGYGNVKIRLTGNAAGKTVAGFYVTNTTYAYKSMLNGDQFDVPFTTDSGDYLLLTINGWYNGVMDTTPVTFFLANYTDSDSIAPYIVHNWEWVSLRELGNVDSLVFSISGSRNDSYGLETPAYFAMDNFITTDLPTLYDTLKYDQDTLLNVLANYPDTTTGGPFTVYFVSNDVPGASVAVDSQNIIFYVPQQGIVGIDTVTYVICNASNQCDTAWIILDLESPTGIKTVNTLQAKVYPNPCGNSFSVYHSSEVKTIGLFDMQGQLIRQIPCTTGELITGITMDNLSSGIYLVKVMTDDAVGVTKITKQ